jgi:hypothetical protein
MFDTGGLQHFRVGCFLNNPQHANAQTHNATTVLHLAIGT